MKFSFQARCNQLIHVDILPVKFNTTNLEEINKIFRCDLDFIFELFSVRQFCQYCVKYLHLIIVQIEKC